MLDFVADIDASLVKLDTLRDSAAYAKQEELKAMRICALALIRLAERHAERADELAAVEPDPTRRTELWRIADVCRACRRTPRATSGRRCNTTGLSTSA